MNKKFWLPAMMLAVAFTSCSNDDDATPSIKSSVLGVDVTVNEMSRAMVQGTALKDNDIIGVSVVAADGSNYDGKTTGYKNIDYTASTENTKQKWTASADIMLSGTVGKAVAYFPYDPNANDYTAIAVDIADQKDWMYSGEVANVSDANSEVSFNLNHAQTAVNVKVVRETNYTGVGLVEGLSVKSAGLAKTGTFSAVDGAWAGLTGADAAIAIAGDFTLTADNAETTDVVESEKENPYMIIPASASAVPFTISADIDGKPYNIEVAMTEAFAPGKVYKISVKITNVGLVVDSVVIVQNWDEEELTGGNLAPKP